MIKTPEPHEAHRPHSAHRAHKPHSAHKSHDAHWPHDAHSAHYHSLIFSFFNIFLRPSLFRYHVIPLLRQFVGRFQLVNLSTCQLVNFSIFQYFNFSTFQLSTYQLYTVWSLLNSDHGVTAYSTQPISTPPS